MIRVATCWDDGLVTDIRLCDILRKYNAKATFNLNPGIAYESTRHPGTWPGMAPFAARLARNEFKSVYDGFCVASHGWMHWGMKNHTMEECLKDAVDAKKYLEDVFQRECPGYAWPGGCIGSDELCDGMRKAGFAYARTVGATENVLPCADPLKLDPSLWWGHEEFFKRWDLVHKNGSDVFYFWGHSCEFRDDEKAWADIENKIRTISEDPETQWVDVIDLVH